MRLRGRHIVIAVCAVLIVGTAAAAYLLHGEPWYKRKLDEAMELLDTDPDAAVVLLREVAACDKQVQERYVAQYFLGWYERNRDPRKALEHLAIAWNELQPGDERFACGLLLSALLYQEGRISEFKRVVSSLVQTRQFSDFAAGEWSLRNRLAAEAAWAFFKKNPAYEIGKEHFSGLEYSRQDYVFWQSVDSFRQIGERLRDGCADDGEFAARVAEFVALNVAEVPGDAPRDFANAPMRSLTLGCGTAEERAWAFASILQAMRIDLLIVRPVPDAAPTVIVLSGQGKWIFDCATMAEVRGADDKPVAFKDYLAAHPPVNLIDYAATDGARYFVFVDPQQVSTRAMLLQTGILDRFAPSPTAPLGVDLVREMYGAGRLVSHRQEQAHAPAWMLPFRFRADAKYQDIVRAAAGDDEKMKAVPPEALPRARAAVEYLAAQETWLAEMGVARILALVGRCDEALVALDTAALKAPDNAEIRRDARYFECLCLYEMGDFAAAAEKLVAFLADDPGRRESAARALLRLARNR